MLKKFLSSNYKYIIGVLTVVIPIFTMCGKYYLNMHSEIETREIKLLQEIIEKKTQKLEDLNVSMVNIRVLLDTNRLLCDQDKFAGNEIELKQKIIVALGDLIEKDFSVGQEFSQNNKHKIADFVQSVYSTKNICAKDFPSDKKLQNEQFKIYSYFSKEVVKYRKVLNLKSNGLFELEG